MERFSTFKMAVALESNSHKKYLPWKYKVVLNLLGIEQLAFIHFANDMDCIVDPYAKGFVDSYILIKEISHLIKVSSILN